MPDVRPVKLSASDPDLGRFIRAGDGVVWGQACAEPTALVDAFLRAAPEIGALSAFLGLSWRDFTGRIPDCVRLVSYGALGRLGRLPNLNVVPCHFSALPRLFAERRLPGDVVLIQVSPPDGAGRCSLGVGVDYLSDALQHARVVIAEVNDHCPRSAGTAIAWERLDAVIHTSRPLLEAPAARPGPTEARIAEHVAAIVEDGDTIQLGVGALPEAILSALSGHRELGIHSGMVSDGVLDLIEAGAVTNARKPADRWLTVTGAALGSRRLFEALNVHEEIMFCPVSYTHAPGTLATVGRLAAINSAVEVDLTGQVNAERAGGRRLGAVGGQVDFLRAAAAHGGNSIIALPAKRIVARLDGPVSTARSDVDWIVTEHGACSLRGLSETTRTEQILRVAGAERAELLQQEQTDQRPRTSNDRSRL
jgi:acyl-CoA hydrolase